MSFALVFTLLENEDPYNEAVPPEILIAPPPQFVAVLKAVFNVKEEVTIVTVPE